MALKIGILYPRSQAHANLAADFTDGIRAVLETQQLTAHTALVFESVGFGGNEKEVYEKAEKLLVLDRVDILVAYIDQRVMYLLNPLFQSSGRLILIINAGANYPENWVPATNMVFLTLQHSYLCWLTGATAAGSGSAAAAVTTTYYDCGYLHIAAFTNGYTRNGGEITFNDVNKSRYNESFDISPLSDYLQTTVAARDLLCVYDTGPAALLYKRLKNHPAAGQLKLFVSPMMLEDTAWNQGETGYPFSIEGHLPYHPALEGEANAQFRLSYSRYANRSPSLFSIQGWESALVLAAVIKHNDEDYTNGAALAALLTGVPIESPRGELVLDGETHYFRAPAYKGLIRANTQELQISPADQTGEEWTNFVADPLTGLSSGWTNTYLCY